MLHNHFENKNSAESKTKQNFDKAHQILNQFSTAFPAPIELLIRTWLSNSDHHIAKLLIDLHSALAENKMDDLAVVEKFLKAVQDLVPVKKDRENLEIIHSKIETNENLARTQLKRLTSLNQSYEEVMADYQTLEVMVAKSMLIYEQLSNSLDLSPSFDPLFEANQALLKFIQNLDNKISFAVKREQNKNIDECIQRSIAEQDKIEQKAKEIRNSGHPFFNSSAKSEVVTPTLAETETCLRTYRKE